MLKQFWDRIANEPALIGAAILAVANLIGADGASLAEFVETVVIAVVGFTVRGQVSPVRSL